MKVLGLTYSFMDAFRAIEVGNTLNEVELHVVISPPAEESRLSHWRGSLRAARSLLGIVGPRTFVHLFVRRFPWRWHAPWRVLSGLHHCEPGNMERAARLKAEGALHVLRVPLHDPRALAWIRERGYDVGLYMWGAIVRRPLLEAFRRGILNAHIGLLPWYRGRSVMEWSLLHGDPTGITLFFMDEGIDTGAEMVLRLEEDVGGHRTVADAKNHLFGRNVDVFRMGLATLQNSSYAPIGQHPGEGRRFYVMSGLLRSVVEAELSARAPRDAVGRAAAP